jgi:hypothetical protein
MNITTIAQKTDAPYFETTVNTIYDNESVLFVIKHNVYTHIQAVPTKAIIRIRKSGKDRQNNCQEKKDKRTKTIYKTLHRRSSNTNPTKNRG